MNFAVRILKFNSRCMLCNFLPLHVSWCRVIHRPKLSRVREQRTWQPDRHQMVPTLVEELYDLNHYYREYLIFDNICKSIQLTDMESVYYLPTLMMCPSSLFSFIILILSFAQYKRPSKFTLMTSSSSSMRESRTIRMNLYCQKKKSIYCQKNVKQIQMNLY